MSTVWTFFGSDGGGAGASAGPGSGAAAVVGIGAGAAEAVLSAEADAVPNDGAAGSGVAEAGAAAVDDGGIGAAPIGIVATTREPTLGGSIFTGCSSRETSLSGAAGVAALDSTELSAWAALLLGTILFGPRLALMIGGRFGNAALPNIAR